MRKNRTRIERFINWLPLSNLMILAVLALTAGITLGAAQAADRNTARWGFNYSTFEVPRLPGSHGYEACEQACERDGRCRSWTYVKRSTLITGQCRLADGVGERHESDCCFSGVKRVAERDRDRDRGDRDRGGRGRERDTGRRAACDHYGKMAAEQAEANRKYNCGFRGPQWGPRAEAHRDWCLYTGRENPEKDIKSRENDLARCFGKMEDEEEDDDRDCERYARRAVLQYERNQELRCGLRGEDWHGDYNRHHRWCERHGERERHAAMRDRWEQLKRCRRD